MKGIFPLGLDGKLVFPPDIECLLKRENMDPNDLDYPPVFLTRRWHAIEAAGSWVFEHYRQRCRDSDVYAAALQLRKQGYPLDLALMMTRAL